MPGKIAGKRRGKFHMRLRIEDGFEFGLVKRVGSDKTENRRLKPDAQQFENIPCKRMHSRPGAMKNAKCGIKTQPGCRASTLRHDDCARVVQHGVDKIEGEAIGELLSRLAKASGSPGSGAGIEGRGATIAEREGKSFKAASVARRVRRLVSQHVLQSWGAGEACKRGVMCFRF
jgi:hypothetical protein